MTRQVLANWVAIAAMDQARGIGQRGRLPWHLPKEFAHFKNTTQGHILLVGKRTWEELQSLPLPRRELWVLSRTLADAPGRRLFRSLAAVQEASQHESRTVFIAGGAVLYQEALPHCHHLILSHINGTYPADTFFPKFEQTFPRETQLQQVEDFRVCRYDRTPVAQQG